MVVIDRRWSPDHNPEDYKEQFIRNGVKSIYVTEKS
jgi:hypothetical protein